jgi:hypothetical protein
MSRIATVSLAIVALCSAGCLVGEGPGMDDDDSASVDSPQSPQGDGWCDSLTFTGMVEGLEATARLSFEPAFERAYVGGEITTPTSAYTFFGDLPIDANTKVPTTDVMWVEVNTTSTGERFRAELRFHEDGFVFIANAYEGAYSTPYEFVCQR